MQRMALRSSIVGRAIRSVTCRRREIFGVTSGSDGELGRQFLSFSTAAASQKPSSSVDTGLVRLVQSEIDSIEHQRQVHLKAFVPDGFPVEIEDNPDDKNLYLTWKYHDEIIKVGVRVRGPSVPKEYYKADDIESFVLPSGYEYKIMHYNFNENERESFDRPRILMTVSVSKGAAHTLVFQISAFCDEISIDDLSVNNLEYSENQLIHGGPYFNSLNDNLREAFTEYLEIRGINHGLTNLMFKYMETKDYNSDVRSEWFKTLKGFMER